MREDTESVTNVYSTTPGVVWRFQMCGPGTAPVARHNGCGLDNSLMGPWIPRVYVVALPTITSSPDHRSSGYRSQTDTHDHRTRCGTQSLGLG